MGAILVAFAVYWLILFVVSFLIVSQGHDTLYDEPPPQIGRKVLLGSLILAAVLTYTRSSFATMFTDNIGPTVIQGIIWFGVFTLIYRFHPWHALGIGLATMVVFTGMATMGVDSLQTPRSSQRFESKSVATPIRRPTYSSPGTAPVAKDAAPAAK